MAFRLATSRLGLLGASMLTALVAATLLIVASVLSPAVAEQTFRGTVDAEPPAEHDLRATTAFNDAWPEVDRDLREITRRHDEIVGEVTTSAWTIATTGQVRLAFGSVRDIDTHAELADGRWPDPGATPIETVLHSDALARLEIDVGDRLTVELLAGASDAVDVLVVGAFEPAEREHVLWRGLGHGALIDEEGDAPTVFGPLLVPTDDLVERVRPGSTTAVWTVGLDLSRISFESADAAILSLARLRDGLADVATGDKSTRVSIAGGTDVLERARDAASSARAVLFVIVTMVMVLAAWALAFTARILAAGRASVTALFRARGEDSGPPVGAALYSVGRGPSARGRRRRPGSGRPDTGGVARPRHRRRYWGHRPVAAQRRGGRRLVDHARRRRSAVWPIDGQRFGRIKPAHPPRRRSASGRRHRRCRTRIARSAATPQAGGSDAGRRVDRRTRGAGTRGNPHRGPAIAVVQQSGVLRGGSDARPAGHARIVRRRPPAPSARGRCGDARPCTCRSRIRSNDASHLADVSRQLGRSRGAGRRSSRHGPGPGDGPAGGCGGRSAGRAARG